MVAHRKVNDNRAGRNASPRCYSWARYYHPTLQRFISEDPIGFGGGDTNLYAYVDNNPLNYVDPLGLRGFTVFGGGQIKGFLSPYLALPCCGAQGTAGARIGTTASSPSAVRGEVYLNAQALAGYGISGGRGAVVGFAFANVEDVPNLIEVGIDTPYFSPSIYLRRDDLVPIGFSIAGASPIASITVAHPDLGFEVKRGGQLDFKGVSNRILGPAGTTQVLGRRK